MSSTVIAGKYKVIRLLGEGTFGKVYQVEHTDIGSHFALKVLKRSLSDNDAIVDRFKTEAQILLKFSHPGSAQLRDFGRTEDGLYYFATDFCDGVSLEKLLEQHGHFEVTQALDVTAQVLDILQAAHDHGITHQDVKPGNILFEALPSGQQQIRILDFGIATLRDAVQREESGQEQGGAVGTPLYMSPEQAAAEPDLDHRVDLYSVGIMLYELISGKVPFDDEDLLQLLIKHLTQSPPPFPLELGVPNGVQQLIVRALEKDRALRFQTASEFAQACRAEWARIQRGNYEAPATPIVVAPLSPEDAQKMPVLCLDDNEMILHIVQHLLDREGFRVITASNFSYIHDHVFVDKVPLMICDINMPGLPGNKICQMLKKMRPDMKIILFSNIPDRELETLAIEAKADRWLSKNTKPDNWLAVIKEVAATI